MEKIFIEKGDICQQQTEAIVNAANTDLLHGGGLAGAIVNSGGDIIQKESNRVAPIELGEAAVTSAGKLKVKYVIHAASMKLGDLTTEENLIKSVRNCLKRADELGISSIAFPAIGTGIGGFPVEQCARISLKEVHDFLLQHPKINKVVFVLRSGGDYNIFNKVNKKLSDDK